MKHGNCSLPFSSIRGYRAFWGSKDRLKTSYPKNGVSQVDRKQVLCFVPCRNYLYSDVPFLKIEKLDEELQLPERKARPLTFTEAGSQNGGPAKSSKMGVALNVETNHFGVPQFCQKIQVIIF